MDDSVFFVENYNEGEKLFNKYIKICESLQINKKKSYIISIKSCFKYCKCKYKILNNGKIICKSCVKTSKVIYFLILYIIKKYNKKVVIFY